MDGLLHDPLAAFIQDTNRGTLEMNIHSDVLHREPPCSGTLIVDQRTIEGSYIESRRAGSTRPYGPLATPAMLR